MKGVRRGRFDGSKEDKEKITPKGVLAFFVIIAISISALWMAYLGLAAIGENSVEVTVAPIDEAALLIIASKPNGWPIGMSPELRQKKLLDAAFTRAHNETMRRTAPGEARITTIFDGAHDQPWVQIKVSWGNP